MLDQITQCNAFHLFCVPLQMYIMGIAHTTADTELTCGEA